MIFSPVPNEIELPDPTLPDGYQIPTVDQIQGLRIEVDILIGIYLITLGFVFHNIIRYLWKQRKYQVF